MGGCCCVSNKPGCINWCERSWKLCIRPEQEIGAGALGEEGWTGGDLRSRWDACSNCGFFCFLRLRASDIMEPNLTYVYPHTRIQSLVSILRTTVHHAFPVVTENRGNEREFMKGNQLISNNIKFKVRSCFFSMWKNKVFGCAGGRALPLSVWTSHQTRAPTEIQSLQKCSFIPFPWSRQRQNRGLHF